MVEVGARSSGVVHAVVVAGGFSGRIHGLTTVERHLRELRALGLEAVVVDRGDAARGRSLDLADDVLWIDGDAIYDPRLLRAASASESTVLVTDDGEAIGLARVDAATARARLAEEHRPWADSVPTLDVASLPSYLPSMRRDLPPYWMRLATDADRLRAERIIMDAAQKGILDFPARFLHPPPENWLAARLALTAVTPNQVTVISALVAFTATYLLATGSFASGLALALVANVLDGVDGKLARITLRTSEGGDRLDHTLDVSFEFSWYLALGWALRGEAMAPSSMSLAASLIATMVACRAVSGTYKLLTGQQIHDHRTFDRWFRLIAGRRNIYVLMLVVGLIVGHVGTAFQAVLLWALVTLGVYLTRNVIALFARRAAPPMGGAATS